jgi:hypothetical protein
MKSFNTIVPLIKSWIWVFIITFFVYGALSITYQSQITEKENNNKFAYDSFFYKNYVSIMNYLGDCPLIQEEINSYVRYSPIEHSIPTLDKIIYITSRCEEFKEDNLFLIYLKENKVIFPDNFDDALFLIQKYWFFINQKDIEQYLSQHANYPASQLLLKKIKENL